MNDHEHSKSIPPEQLNSDNPGKVNNKMSKSRKEFYDKTMKYIEENDKLAREKELKAKRILVQKFKPNKLPSLRTYKCTNCGDDIRRYRSKVKDPLRVFCNQRCNFEHMRTESRKKREEEGGNK